MINTSGLSLEQAPPFDVPARFFLTAPLFAIAAGLVLMTEAEAPFSSRWLPATLALTHLIALGFLGQVMCGALLQMLPVVAGAPVPRVRLVGTLTHLLLGLGAFLLAWGFWQGDSPWILAGGTLSGSALLVFLIPVTYALVRARGAPGTLMSLRAAVLALLVTLVLGATLVGVLLGQVRLEDFSRWVDAHATWGLLGWVGLLVVGVATQLVPMFYVTPLYSAGLRRWLSPVLLIALALGTSAWVLGWDRAGRGLIALAVIGFALFATSTLALLRQRGRRQGDATLWHWHLAMSCVLGAAMLWTLSGPSLPVGLLLLAGLGLGLPAAMLFKILPFLAWFHLQHRQLTTGRFDQRIPHMGALLPQGWARTQFAVHLLALILLIGAVWAPVLTPVAGLVLALAGLIRLVLLAGVIQTYRLCWLRLTNLVPT